MVLSMGLLLSESPMQITCPKMTSERRWVVLLELGLRPRIHGEVDLAEEPVDAHLPFERRALGGKFRHQGPVAVIGLEGGARLDAVDHRVAVPAVLRLELQALAPLE